MITYKLINTVELDGSIRPVAVIRSDGWSIPFEPANTDYQEYLKWVAAGNTPLPADEV
jgi:hypothetical protein